MVIKNYDRQLKEQQQKCIDPCYSLHSLQENLHAKRMIWRSQRKYAFLCFCVLTVICSVIHDVSVFVSQLYVDILLMLLALDMLFCMTDFKSVICYTTRIYFLTCFRAVSQEDPYTRMKSVVKWYLSGFYKKPKVSIHEFYIMFLLLSDAVAVRLTMKFQVQSTFDISKWKFIPNYRYLKVNFLVPENLFSDSSCLR